MIRRVVVNTPGESKKHREYLRRRVRELEARVAELEAPQQLGTGIASSGGSANPVVLRADAPVPSSPPTEGTSND